MSSGQSNAPVWPVQATDESPQTKNPSQFLGTGRERDPLDENQ
jgi:hypothetical protein